MTTRNRQPAPVIPTAVGRLAVRSVLALAIIAAINFAWFVFVFPKIFPSGGAWRGLLVNVPLTFAMILWPGIFFLSLRRIRCRLDEYDWMLCPKCEQDLRGLDDEPFACPECGRVWTTRQIRLSWEKIAGRRKKPAGARLYQDQEPSP